MEKHTEASSLQLEMSMGKVYNTLSEISTSYQDASEQLRYKLYYHETKTGSSGSAAPSIPQEYFLSIIQQINNSLSHSDSTMASALCQRLSAELFSSNLALSDIKMICKNLIDTLVEKSLSCCSSDAPIDDSRFMLLSLQTEQTEHKDELASLIESASRELLEAIYNESLKKQHRLIARAKEYIAANYSNCDLSLNDIAQHAECTASYLSNIFTEYTHENLVAYLNTYRINIAKNLLVNSSILIKDIGFKTGFNTIQNFNRVFKKNTGMTPNEYRKKYQTIRS